MSAEAKNIPDEIMAIASGVAARIPRVPSFMRVDVAYVIAKSIHDAVMAERERDKSQSIISAPIGQQLLVWEPMYGWLIATRSPFDHLWRLKSSGNHWMDTPAEVEFTHWISLPAAPKAEEA